MAGGEAGTGSDKKGQLWKIQLLLFPNPTGNPELQLLPISPREEECHVAVNDETIKLRLTKVVYFNPEDLFRMILHFYAKIMN